MNKCTSIISWYKAIKENIKIRLISKRNGAQHFIEYIDHTFAE